MDCAQGLQFDCVTVGYPGCAPVLHSVSLKFSAPGIYALVGRNGCGKSTLLSAAAGFVPLLDGRVVFNLNKSDDCGLMEYLPQDYREALFPWKRVLDNVYPWRSELVRDDNCGLSLACLDRLGIRKLAQRLPNQLSGGEQQLVLLARTLRSKRPVLLLDEPFSALDVVRRAQTVPLLRDHWRREQRLVLCTMHEVEGAARLADHVLVFDGPPLRLATIVDSEDGAKYLQTSARILDEIAKLDALPGEEHAH
jgi:ABC-type nitrate/sulfonate/bicarbonate transport system ATPase subunit